MDDQLFRYEKYASCIKRTLLLAGLWSGSDISKFSRLLAVVYVIASTISCFGIMCFVFHHIKDIGLITKGLGLIVSLYTALLKVLVFTIHRRHVVQLHDLLETGFRTDLDNSELRPVLLSSLEIFYRPTALLSTLTWVVVFIYNLTPLISIIIQRAHGVKPLKYRTPLPTLYPWSFADNKVIYLAQYITEAMAGIGNGFITTGTDALFGFYIFQMASQFRTLSYRMTKLATTNDYHVVMKDCASRSQMLARCRDILQTLYGPIIMWMLISSSMSICANIFQASQISSDKAILVLVYILMKLGQTLLYGWYGLFLTNESEAFRDAIYFSGWPDFNDRSVLSNTLIMLMNKPLILKACHFSVISLDMFMGISNTAISYFFLLRTIDEK